MLKEKAGLVSRLWRVTGYDEPLTALLAHHGVELPAVQPVRRIRGMSAERTLGIHLILP